MAANPDVKQVEVGLTVVSRRKYFLCRYCPTAFEVRDDLVRHMATHRQPRATCATCGKGFTSVKGLKLHLRSVHTEVTAHPCPTCGQACKSRRDLGIHLRTHTGEKPFKCTTCPRDFGREQDLRNHSRIHTMETPYKCITCFRDFAKEQDLMIHCRLHTGESTYKCDSCPMAFRYSRTLTTHKARAHVEAREEKIEPKSKAENQLPIETLKTSLRKCIVPENGLEFYVDQDFHLKQISHTQGVHLGTHTGEKVASCATCGKGFTRVKSLKVHMRIVHSGETPYKCDSCHMTFRYSRTLTTHKARAHVEASAEKVEHKTKAETQVPIETLRTGPKERNEPVAGLEFCVDPDLKLERGVHTVTHTGEKEATCAICGKAFTRVKGLKMHMRIVHMGESPYKCDSCHMTFRYSRSLRAHKARAHVEGSEEKVEPKAIAENQVPIEILSTGTEEKDDSENGLEFYVDHDFHLKELSIPIQRMTCKTVWYGVQEWSSCEGNPRYVCCRCGRGHRDEGSAKGHALRCKAQVCRLCRNSFASPFSLKRHLALVHDRGPGALQHGCWVCGQRFFGPFALRRHEVRHRENSIQDVSLEDSNISGSPKRYECRTCRKAFRCGAHLRRHELIHSAKDVLVQCPECPLQFRSHRLQIHIDLRHRDTKYTSSYCDRLFTSYSHKYRHDQAHKNTGICKPSRGR